MSHAFRARLCAKNEASEEEADFRGCERNDIWWYSLFILYSLYMSILFKTTIVGIHLCHIYMVVLFIYFYLFILARVLKNGCVHISARSGFC